MSAPPPETGPVAIGSASPSDLQRSYEIAPQSLLSALEQYGAASGVSLIYDSALAAGRTSPGVHGVMTARAALQSLLEGSGLAPRYTGSDTLVLLPVRPEAVAEAGATGAEAALSQRRYYGLVQSRVRDAFCAQPPLAEGRYRVALRLWVDVSGTIGRVSLLDSTGDKALDGLVEQALRGAPVGEPLPAGLAQPFTLVVMPRASGQNWGCPLPAAPASSPAGRRHHG